jgi:putative sigma-54 modulation protein
MYIQFTARHFKAPVELQQFAESSVTGLANFYDGIVSAEIVLEERPHGGDDKMAEIVLSVYKEQLFAKEMSDDIMKSIQLCVDKLERQLVRYKDKLHEGQRPHERPEIARQSESEIAGGSDSEIDGI